MSQETNTDKEMTGHEYDGIRELDNPLPRWWVLTFLGAIIYSFFYVIHYHTGTNLLIQNEYKSDLAIVQAQKGPQKPTFNEGQFNSVVTDNSQLMSGREIFVGKCAACHGVHGEGGIGPNLTDSYWIHGKGVPQDIFQVVNEGVTVKGMPPWGTMLTKEELIKVVAYASTLKGSHPEHPKAPEGQKVE